MFSQIVCVYSICDILCLGGGLMTGGSAGCTDTPGVNIGGQSCAQYLSVPTNSFACSWDIITKHCCASKSQYCSTSQAIANGMFG